MDPFWQEVNAGGLGQGDLIPACAVPVIRPDFDQATLTPGTPAPVDVQEFDLIVMTQSCDLENGKAPLVACCPIHTLTDFESVNPDFSKIGQWERVRQGRVEGRHLLACPTTPDDKWTAYVVNFRIIYSLPIAYLTARAEKLPKRWRLRPPYLEHFSQAFARFFMRVGLPSAIPSYDLQPKRPPTKV